MSTEPVINVIPAIVADQDSIPQSIPTLDTLNPEIEIAKVLAVPETDLSMTNIQEINESVPEFKKINVIKPEKSNKSLPFVPGGVKTRADLIRKIQESSQIFGNEADVKAMRLHRRRRNSLDGILKDQIAKCVTQEAENRLGIPPAEDQEGRLSYAVDML